MTRLNRRDFLAVSAAAAAGTCLTQVTACSSETTPLPTRIEVGERQLFFGASDSYEVLSNDHAVRRINANGDLTFELGGRGNGPGEFNLPLVAAEVGTELYVLEGGGSRIQRFDANGQWIATHGARGAGDDLGRYLEAPRNMTVVGERVYVAYGFDYNVQVLHLGDGSVQELGSRGTGRSELNVPVAVAIDPLGDVHVADVVGKVLVFDAGGRFLRRYAGRGDWSGRVMYLSDLAIDAQGLSYIADGYRPKLEVFDIFGGHQATLPVAFDDGSPAYPRHLAWKPDGTLYVYALPGAPA